MADQDPQATERPHPKQGVCPVCNGTNWDGIDIVPEPLPPAEINRTPKIRFRAQCTECGTLILIPIDLEFTNS